jgi:hypothetical protein
LSLQMSQLLGPEDGFKVVALLADGDPWRQHGAVPCCLWQSSRTKPALERISMLKDVLDASSGVERSVMLQFRAQPLNALHARL